MPFSQFEIVECLLLLEGSIGLEGSGCLVLAGRSYKLGSAANIFFFTNLESKNENRKNCKSSRSQVTRKVKLKSQFCMSASIAQK